MPTSAPSASNDELTASAEASALASAPGVGVSAGLSVGIADVLLGVSILGGVWVALPARWWPVDVGGSVLGGLLLGSGGLLLRSHRRVMRGGKPRVPCMVLWVHGLTLMAGLGVISLLAWSVSLLVGLYGPVGGGGALILSLVAALLIPYLVVLPWWQLRVLMHITRES
jgi:hypothetical protein